MIIQITDSLTVDYSKKRHISIKYPTINFFDAQSLATWLEARKIALNMGSRYTLRVHYITLCLIILVALSWLNLLATLGRFIPNIFEV